MTANYVVDHGDGVVETVEADYLYIDEHQVLELGRFNEDGHQVAIAWYLPNTGWIAVRREEITARDA